jgi:hypothetical protein
MVKPRRAIFRGTHGGRSAKAASNPLVNWCVPLNPIWQIATSTQRNMFGERTVLKSWKKFDEPEKRWPLQKLFLRN